MILRTVDNSKIPPRQQPVRAFLTVINCTPENEEGVMRRYNVHAVDRLNPFELTNLDRINNYFGGKLGYEVNSHHAIGDAIITGKTVFRTINADYEPSDQHLQSEDWGKAVVSLSIPINVNIDGDGIRIKYYGNMKKGDNDDCIIIKGYTKTIATVTFEFHEDIQELFHIPPEKIKEKEYPIDIKIDSNRRIKNAATACTELIIDYLGLDASAGKYIESANPPSHGTKKHYSILDKLTGKKDKIKND